MVIERVANRSKSEGFFRSRLSPLSEEDVAYLKGTYDFFALNHYSAYMVKNLLEPPTGDPSGTADRHVEELYNPLWVGSIVPWLKVNQYSPSYQRIINTANNIVGSSRGV